MPLRFSGKSTTARSLQRTPLSTEQVNFPRRVEAAVLVLRDTRDGARIVEPHEATATFDLGVRRATGNEVSELQPGISARFFHSGQRTIERRIIGFGRGDQFR